MSASRLATAVAFKATAFGAAFVNVVFAATALSQADAFLYLSMLSLIQLTIPFAGLGLGQRLVRLREGDDTRWRAGPWFLASILLGIGVLALQALAADAAPERWSLLALCAVLLTHIVLSEWVRAMHARQKGFFYYNISLLAVAGLFWVQGGVGFLPLVPALAALGLLLRRERAVFFARGGTPTRPGRDDALTAIRVSAVNQYYNIIVVMLSFLVASPAVLSLVLVWRFNIFFNWQTFYWLRFGHKDTIDGMAPARVVENRRVNRLNRISGLLLCAGLLALFPGGLIAWTEGTPFGREFFALLAAFAALRLFINLIFPFELFAVYRGSGSRASIFIAIAALGFEIVAIAALALESALAVLLVVEAVSLAWRLWCRREERLDSARSADPIEPGHRS